MYSVREVAVCVLGPARVCAMRGAACSAGLSKQGEAVVAGSAVTEAEVREECCGARGQG